MATMAIYLKDPNVDRLAREIARLEGTSVTEAIRNALSERHAQLMAAREERERRVDECLARLRALPVLDPRRPDEMLYDENGNLR